MVALLETDFRKKSIDLEPMLERDVEKRKEPQARLFSSNQVQYPV